MSDRLTEILERTIDQLRTSVALMKEGRLTTRTNNVDTTQENIVQSEGWIADLEGVLAKHQNRAGED